VRTASVGTRLLIGYLAALAVTECLMAVSVPVAAAGYALLALALCLALPLVAQDRTAALVPILVTIAVVRLIVVATPGGGVTPAVRLGAVAVPTFVAVLLAGRGHPREWRFIPAGRAGWGIQAAVVLVGLPLAAVVRLLAPSLAPSRTQLPLLAAVTLLVLAVVPDELLFRWLLVPAATGVAGAAGVPLSAAVYAATFAGYLAAAPVAVAFTVGLVLSWLRARTGAAIGVVGARIVLVLVIYLVFPPAV
jgi:hypothetical protein